MYYIYVLYNILHQTLSFQSTRADSLNTQSNKFLSISSGENAFLQYIRAIPLEKFLFPHSKTLSNNSPYGQKPPLASYWR